MDMKYYCYSNARVTQPRPKGEGDLKKLYSFKVDFHLSWCKVFFDNLF